MTSSILVWNNPKRRSWLAALALGAFAACADAPDADEQAPEGTTELSAAPAAEQYASLDEDTPASELDVENLAYGSDSTIRFLGMYGSTSGGDLYQWVPGNGAVIFAVQVRSGSSINAIRFQYYHASHPDNRYRGEPIFWTQWFGGSGGTQQAVFECPGITGINFFSAGWDSGRLRWLGFQCSRLDIPDGSYSGSEISPAWGGNSAANFGYAPCAADELAVSFNIRTDGTYIKGLEIICKDKQ